MKNRALMILLMALGMSSVVAEEERSGFEAAIGAGRYFYDEKNLEAANMGILSLGYQINNSWQVEMIYGNPDTDGGGANYDVDWGALRGLYLLNDSNKNVPYVSVGVADMDVIKGEKDIVVGLGIKLVADNNAFVRLESNYHTGEGDISVMAMVGYQFGESAPAVMKPKDTDMDGVMDNMDACPKTPAGTPVDERGCMVVDKDTDGDGVVDRLDQCPSTPAGALVDDNGCQKSLEKEVSVNLQINFSTNSDVVAADYDSELKEVADFMKQYAGTSVVIEGHTDSVGRADYNQSLSERRAASVAKALAERFGIATDRISSKGYGETNPVASNEDADGRTANRRVVAVMSEKVTEKQWNK